MTPMRIVGICVSPIITEGCLCHTVENVWVSGRAELIEGCLHDPHKNVGIYVSPVD